MALGSSSLGQDPTAQAVRKEDITTRPFSKLQQKLPSPEALQTSWLSSEWLVGVSVLPSTQSFGTSSRVAGLHVNHTHTVQL